MLSSGFHRTIHSFYPVPFGSSDRIVRYNMFSAAYAVGKWKLAFTAFRNREFNDSKLSCQAAADAWAVGRCLSRSASFHMRRMRTLAS